DERMAVTALLVDREGSVWSGTRGAGIHRSKRGLFTAYSEAEGLAGANVHSVYEDQTGAIWAGTLGDGMSRIAADGRVVASYTPDDGYPMSVYTLHSDRDDRLWVGGSIGLHSCSLPAMRCTRVESPALGNQEVVALHEAPGGRLWAGTSEGVIEFLDGQWVPLAGWPLRTPIRAFASTRDGALWVATNGDGVVRYHNGTFVHLTTADGLPGDILRSLHEDRDGWLWVGTEGRGLARIDP